MAFKVVPIGDRIVVRRDPSETMTPGGIALPERAQEKKKTGEVIAVGTGYYTPKGMFVPTTLRPGDAVMFGSYAGVEIEIDGETYQILREGDVAGVVSAQEE